jgi:DNA invertase Pin-like site-specific DNA recombinase
MQSGLADNGSGLTRMMDDAHQHKLDAIIVEDVSRLSRRVDRVGALLATLRNLDVALFIVNQSVQIAPAIKFARNLSGK